MLGKQAYLKNSTRPLPSIPFPIHLSLSFPFCGLFYGRPYLDYVAQSGRTNDEPKTIWEQQWPKLYNPSICLEGLTKPRKISVRIAGVPAEIRTQQLPNASPQITARPVRTVSITITLLFDAV
jgi:hypothetical protein